MLTIFNFRSRSLSRRKKPVYWGAATTRVFSRNAAGGLRLMVFFLLLFEVRCCVKLCQMEAHIINDLYSKAFKERKKNTYYFYTTTLISESFSPQECSQSFFFPLFCSRGGAMREKTADTSPT